MLSADLHYATTEFSTCPPLSVPASCCVLHPALCSVPSPPMGAGGFAAACLDEASWAQGGSRLFAISTLIVPQSLAIKKAISD